MDETKYLELLDKAYSDLPEVMYKKDRFEIPQVKGRLIKSRTVISNFTEISKLLSRETSHFSRFMLRELGVRGEVDQRGELVLHSRFQPGILNKGVQNYYKNFVQCPNCNSPDTVLQTDSTEIKCNACGHIEKVNKL